MLLLLGRLEVVLAGGKLDGLLTIEKIFLLTYIDIGDLRHFDRLDAEDKEIVCKTGLGVDTIVLFF